MPLNDDEQSLTSARPGEGSRPWSAGAGCGALATGLVQVTWSLQRIRALLEVDCSATLDWTTFERTGGGLFIWEAFVSGQAKASNHIDDARVGATAFIDAMPSPEAGNAVRCDGDVHSLVGAAMLRTGWSNDIGILQAPCLVIRAR